MKVASGKLDRRVDIISQTTTRDALGQVVSEWTPQGSTYAQRLELRTQDATRGGGRDTFTVSRFLIRWRADLTTSHRVRVDNKLYDILAIDEPDRRETMILMVEEADA